MSVEQSWTRIVNWLQANAPQTAATIRPAASADALEAAAGTFPRPWPEALRAWYRLHNGETSPRLFTGVLPGYASLLGLERIVAASRDYQEIFAEIAEQNPEGFDDQAELEDQPAGEMAIRFLRSWVPIGEDGTGCTMFVDCRPGDQSGCVTIFDRDEGDTGGPAWDSVEALLSDLADALHHGRVCGGWQPQAVGGVLEWEPA